ncbi:MAG TPA: nicotinate-nucleotide diphosphorylase (carboxylating), partial [Actinomycetota bacterium]|nr:nicotinate-nucleotide diphosphorylase (carboxylating) [Actinomycetota bacterium]
MNNELDLSLVRPLVESWLAEDVGRGDVTSASVIPEKAYAVARLEARESFVVAGIDVAGLCFEIVGGGRLDWDPKVDDGHVTQAAETLARVEGNLRSILTAERTAINAFARLSGVASLTSDFAQSLWGTKARLVDTRKTTPGLRVLEKYAVRVG